MGTNTKNLRFNNYRDLMKKIPELKNLVFGELDKYESYLLERKHLNHHFEQFGLI